MFKELRKISFVIVKQRIAMFNSSWTTNQITFSLFHFLACKIGTILVPGLQGKTDICKAAETMTSPQRTKQEVLQEYCFSASHPAVTQPV